MEESRKLKLVDCEEYFKYFDQIINPFLTREFIELNKSRVDELFFLVENNGKPQIGIVLGRKNRELFSPFSAPFGGFNYKHENIYISAIEEFVIALSSFVKESGLSRLNIVLPPSIYGSSFNSKAIHSMRRNGYISQYLELTSYVNLESFNNRFSTKSSREYYHQAKRNGLLLKKIEDENTLIRVHDLIKENRESKGRELKMTLRDFEELESFWDLDFFGVFKENDEMVASGIFYRFKEIGVVYTAIWGDNDVGRALRAMDFLTFKIWELYKSEGYRFIDLGISTEQMGVPNEGLLRFKETHDCSTELRHVLAFKA